MLSTGIMASPRSSFQPTVPSRLNTTSETSRRPDERAEEPQLPLQATSEADDPMRSAYLSSLVCSLTRQFQCTKDDHILNSAIWHARQALVTFSGPPPMRWGKIQNIAFLLEARINLASERGQLSRAVELSKEAVSEIPDGHENHTRLLGILSEQLRLSYENGKQERDLIEAIERGEEATLEAQQTMLSNPRDRAVIIFILCQALEAQYLLHRNDQDLERLLLLVESISVHGVENEVIIKCKWAQYLASRYSNHGGSVVDLDRAVDLSMSFLDLPCGDPDRLSNLDNTIHYLCMKYDHYGQESDLDKLTALIQAEMEHARPGQSRPHLKNLYLLQTRRYINNGSLNILHEAIHDCEEVLGAMSNEDEMWPACLSNLGCLLRMKHEQLGESDVLEESIYRGRTAIAATRSGDPDLIFRKTNLACSLAQKYVRTTLLQDLRPVIQLGREILEAVPERHVDRFKYLNNVGVWLSWSYMQTKDPLELDECIEFIREAIQLAPHSHVIRYMSLNNLCACLKMRQEHTKSELFNDLEDAIKYGREAVSRLPGHHPMKVRALRNLFEALKSKYEKTHEKDVRGQAVDKMKECIQAEGSPPSHRLNFVFDAIPWLEAHDDWRNLSQITESATELLGRVSPRSVRQQDQQYILRRYAGLASTAAAAALQMGKSKEQALRLLEHGRGTITSTLLQNRRSISSLRRKHPTWAKEFEELRDALDPPLSFGMDGALANAPQTSMLTELSAEGRYRKTEELEKLLGQIRADDAFETFLLPLTIEEMMSAAPPNQTVVAINVARFRCDAFIIHSNQISIVELPALNHQLVERKAKHFRSRKSRDAYEILEWLWDNMIERILVQLGADKPCVDDDYAKWPRVYWVPTGPLRLLPIHAAGYHRDSSGRSVIDRVVSSYSLSVEEILYGQEIKAGTEEARQAAQLVLHPPNQTEAACKFVFVSMESTPGNSSLPYARKEIHTIWKMLPPCLPRRYFDRPSRDNLLRGMSGCTVFHFAGHGMTDPRDPSLSGLLLRSDDGNYTVPLTVRDLQALRFQETGPPLLAYLSACSTGRIADEQLVDEGIHLMGACRLAGFRHVIGSLWEVSDRLCVDVARTVYETILKACLDDASVAHGLHHAVRMLRTKLLAGRNKTRRNEEKTSRKSQTRTKIQSNAKKAYRKRRRACYATQRNVKKASQRSRRGPSLWAAFIHTGV
ncbi:CHAT domain-containing protein [Xylaria sp. FL1777]|nr:CHAT domain-containing protein [Xylaria sp. FL1777]